MSMKSIGRHLYRVIAAINPGVVGIFFVALVTMTMAFTSAHAEDHHADKVRVVQGIIQNINDNAIKVNEKYYTILGVRITNGSEDPEEEPLTIHDLKEGEKVDIYFQGNQVTSVFAYGEFVE